MRIAVVVFEFPALSETFALNQITGLIDRGHQVDIYALNGPPSQAGMAHADVAKYGLLDRTTYAPTLPTNRLLRILKAVGLVCSHLWRIPGPVLRSLNVFSHGRQAASLSLLAATIALVGRGSYDIILNQFGTVGLLTMPIRKWGAIDGKLVTFFRGADISHHVRMRGDTVYSTLFDEGDLFLTNCEFFKHRLRDLGCDERKLFVHGSGIDCESFCYAPPHFRNGGPIRVATTGRLIEKKGVQYGIRAVANLVKSGRRVEYHIIGDGPLKNDLEKMVQDLELCDSVRLHGAQCRRSIVELLRESHVFIAPCLTAANGDQDAPVNSLKEAMAIGVPVIGTRHGGIPELIEDGTSGFLVPERDHESLAEKIRWLVDHPEIAREMTKAARKYVEAAYDTNRLNDQLVERFQNLIDGKPVETVEETDRVSRPSIQES